VMSGRVAVEPADRAPPPVTDSPPVGMSMARSNHYTAAAFRLCRTRTPNRRFVRLRVCPWRYPRG
jgi:hypothetical protein